MKTTLTAALVLLALYALSVLLDAAIELGFLFVELIIDTRILLSGSIVCVALLAGYAMYHPKTKY